MGGDVMTVALLGPNGVDSVLLANPNNKAKTVDASDLALDSFVKSRIGSAGGLNFRNKIVDGRFDFWYEGVSQTTNGYGSDTMWANGNTGSTKTNSRQSFIAGVDLPSIEAPTAKFFSRTVVSSIAGAGNNVFKYQNIENVTTLAGKTATLSFYAKADAVKNIAFSFNQIFGSGGSAAVAFGSRLIALSTEWKRYSFQVAVPSISGKTIGSSGDCLQVIIAFDMGSTYSAQYGGMIQQSGTFDIACVQLEEGSVATTFEELPIEISQTRVNRYFEQVILAGTIAGTYRGSTTIMLTSILPFNVRKRAIPVLTAQYISTLSAMVDAGISSSALTGVSLADNSLDVYQLTVTAGSVAIGSGFRYIYFGPQSTPSIINFDARL